MTTDLDGGAAESVPQDPAASTGSALRTGLIAVIVVAALAIAIAGGFSWGRDSKHVAIIPTIGSVDAGFAQDMTVHHKQAVTMAAYARDYTDSATIKLLAYDIEDQQTFQVGQMQGWLDNWGVPAANSSPMTWMAGHGHLASGGLMPGMATQAEIDHLRTLHGTVLDIDFLQLMIRHHQGGVPMAQYAAAHATEPYVRDLAQSIVVAQSSEIVQMEQLLRQLGGAPLPAPTS
ncbi:MAG: hypothetical protein QOG80_1535 [Pseudonocardiales bacterium]|jgi:uncharacterized protein (DUF305 family)|nr:hypothetical protein [Pseudonocardiales bacterium]